MIPVEEAIRVINRERGDAVAVFSYTGALFMNAISERPELDLPCGTSLGKATDVALGIALARPDRKVIVIDGDGALLMNLGSLVTIANMEPKNLCHIVLHDGIYLTTGGQPTPGGMSVDFSTIARGAGFPHCYSFVDVEVFAAEFRTVLLQPGPNFVSLSVVNPQQMPAAPCGRRFGQAARDIAEALRAA